MRLDKLTYDVREAVRQYSDDSEISDRYIHYLYGIKRGKYLRQALNNYQRTFDNSILQSFCIELEEVNVNECGITIECSTLLRTVTPIPKPLELHTKVAISNVKPTNRLAIPFNFISKKRAAFVADSFFQTSIYSFLDDDGYIYVTSPSFNEYKLLNCLTITGVFEDPLELANYSNCCGCDDPAPCFDMTTTDYPLQPHNIDLIKNEIVQDLLRFLQIPEDKANDASDNYQNTNAPRGK